MVFIPSVLNAKKQSGLALAKAINELENNKFSELTLSRKWLENLQLVEDFYSSGWYIPPPSGIISIFGKKEDDYLRISQPSFRPRHMWPSEDMAYDNEDIIALYASPILRTNLVIGDFGLTLYQGFDQNIKEHCTNVLLTSLKIAGKVKLGMSFSEIYEMGIGIASGMGYKNDIESTTDKAGTNIGHTIPFINKQLIPEYNKGEEAIKKFSEIISSSRRFVSASETMKVEDNTAFTIEPRFSTDDLPQMWFHLTVAFYRGQKIICHGFKPVLEAMEINYLNKYLERIEDGI